MNKKLEIICLVFAVLLSNILYANDTPCHVSGFSNGYRVFYGFDFGEPKISDHDLSIEGIVNEEINCVLNDDAENNNTSDYAIVGHSQGGLRVLSYATMLKERACDKSLGEDERKAAEDSYNRLKAVITVSGIDRGLKALDGGFAPFRAKVLNDGEILGNGLIGVGGS